MLFEHPAVAEAAVLGRPDPIRGEVVRACVVLRAGHSASADDLIDRCRRRLASYKVPVVVEFLTASPEPDREDPQEEPEVGAGEGGAQAGQGGPASPFADRLAVLRFK